MSECSDGDAEAKLQGNMTSLEPRQADNCEPRQVDDPGPCQSEDTGLENAKRAAGSIVHLPSLLLRRHNHQNQVPGFREHGGRCRRRIVRLEQWYVSSWWAQFVCGVATVLGMIIDPVLDYCTIYVYAHTGHVLWTCLGVFFVLLSPWLSFWLHLRASRANLVRSEKKLWLKLLVVPAYEAAVGWRAIKFMWGVRGDPKMYPAIEVAMSEVLIIAGQEAVFESLPQLILQSVAYFHAYYGTATKRQNMLFVASMVTSTLVITSRITSTLLFLNDGGLSAFAYLTRTKQMRHTLATAVPFTAAREAEMRTKGATGKGFGGEMWQEIERQVYREGTSASIRREASWAEVTYGSEDEDDEGLPASQDEVVDVEDVEII